MIQEDNIMEAAGQDTPEWQQDVQKAVKTIQGMDQKQYRSARDIICKMRTIC